MRFKEHLKYLVYCLDLLGQEFFFCTCSLLGIHYEGAGSSSLYVLYCVILFSLTMLFVLNDLLKYRKQLKKFIFLIVPLLFSFLFLIEYSITPETGSEWTWKSYMFFILFCMPAMYVGTIIGSRKEINILYPYFDLVILIMSLGLLKSIPNLLATGIASLTGGESSNYNTIAYCSAICFGFIYYGLLSNREDRFGILRTKLFRIISIFLLPALVFCGLSSGGRGGSLLLIVLFLYITWKFVGRISIIKSLVLGIPLLLVVLFASSKFIESNALLSAAFDAGTERAFQYITGKGIDMTYTSGRDIIYENALTAVKEDPFAIRGLFRTIGMRGYPHNFFIEVLLDGGVFYFLFWVFFLLKILFKGIGILKRNTALYFMSIVSLYVLLSTFFGGTYLMTGIFWFFISLIYTYPVNIEKNEKNINFTRQYS